VKIAIIAGSPSASSRGAVLLKRVEDQAKSRGIDVGYIDVRDIPAADLVTGDPDSLALRNAAALIAEADGVAIASPVYKAAYTGLLKCFLDVFPVETTLAGKLVFPVVTAAAPTHLLALDYALKPVLASLGASYCCAGFGALDSYFDKLDDGSTVLKEAPAAKFDLAIAAFLEALVRLATNS
jgi:FMN reductase